jgi:hypothetical protein
MSMSHRFQDQIDKELAVHHAEQSDDAFALPRDSFEATHFALASFILPERLKSRLSDEIRSLVKGRSVRRELQLKETAFTQRRMRNVTAEDIRAHDGWTAAVYRSGVFREMLSRITGEAVILCPYDPEQYIITQLEQGDDTHGWHWDDYSFGVIFVVDCPPVEDGGFVQCITGTQWNKENPRVYRAMVERPIRSYELRRGDVYVLRTDTTLHRVHPILRGTRTIVNFAYAAARDLGKEISHETMEDLFGQRQISGAGTRSHIG